MFQFVIVALLAAAIIVWAKHWNNTRPLREGKHAEEKVSGMLRSLSPDHYITVDDIMLEKQNGTVQIDHIVISNYGIFIVETKNYSGDIYGHESSEKWKQVINYHSYKFYNPVRQNKGHIMTLKQKFPEIAHLPFISIVVFMRKASLHVTVENSIVVRSNNLLDEIKKYDTPRIPDSMRLKVYDLLRDNDVSSEEMNKQHKQNIIDNQHRLAYGYCPLCGRDLVERHGPYGSFWGCSGYPECKFKKKI